MAIIDCDECGKEVSTTAKTCPHCGAPFKKFMGKSKKFMDRFTPERYEAAEIEARANLKEKGKSLFGCLWSGIGLIVLLLIIVAIL